MLNLEKFLEKVVEHCGWRVAKSHGSNYEKLRETIEKGAGFKFDDWTDQPAKLEELFLARNDWVHNNGIVRASYTNKIPSPRFVKEGRIVVGVNQIPAITQGLRNFAVFIASKCKRFSKAFRGPQNN